MSERFIPEHRRTNFKAKGTFKPEELRRRREEQQVEIRKAKREDNLAKRRGLTGGDLSSRPGASLGAAPDSDDDTAPTESQVRYSHNSNIFYNSTKFLQFASGLDRILRQQLVLFCLHRRLTPHSGGIFSLGGVLWLHLVTTITPHISNSLHYNATDS